MKHLGSVVVVTVGLLAVGARFAFPNRALWDDGPSRRMS
jgi:hypothetical protein